jgi:hypothetical protein
MSDAPVQNWLTNPKITVPAGGDAPVVVATAGQRPERGVLLQASPSNAANSTVQIFSEGQVGNGVLLAPGQSVFLPVRDPRTIFCFGSTAGLDLRVAVF